MCPSPSAFPPLPTDLWFVAKDICLLIHVRKGNVAKSVGQFAEAESK